MMIVTHIAPRPVFTAWKANENWMIARRTYRTRMALPRWWIPCGGLSGGLTLATVKLITVRPLRLSIDNRLEPPGLHASGDDRDKSYLRRWGSPEVAAQRANLCTFIL